MSVKLPLPQSVDSGSFLCRISKWNSRFRIPSMRGTVQREVFEGRRASTYEKGESLVICVKCSKEGALRKPVKCAIVVSLENPEGYLPIYQNVKARLRPSLGAIVVPPLRS